MKDQKPIKGRHYIPRLIAEGEHETQDFKFAISDARKIAKSLSAFANNAGGRLLVGVKDNGVIAGVRTDEDIYLLQQAAEMCCRPPQTLRITPFACDGGVVVVRAEIAPSSVKPVKALEPDGSWKAYFRVRDENISAPPLMVKAWAKAASRRGTLFTLGDAENELLAVISSFGSLSVDDFYTTVKMTRARAEEVLAGLIATDVVRLRYIDGHFRLQTDKE